MLRFEDVRVRFGDQEVLRGVSFGVKAGSTTALIGASGSGKSTLLRLVVGLVRASSGRVLLDGMDCGRDLGAVRRRVGYVIQDGGLMPHLTTARNVGIQARDAGWDSSRIRARVEELAELVRLPASTLDRPPGELSGGQQQRVALMRGLMMDPEVLLLDEPLGALDPVVRHGLQEELKGVFRALGKTVVLVTHDIAEAGYFSDDLVLLHKGVVTQRGSLSEMSGSPASGFVSEFVGANRLATLADAGLA